MCTVSMIGDHYRDKWEKTWPTVVPSVVPGTYIFPQVSKEDFDKLKTEVMEMKELLKKAKIYDIEHNQPNCEIEDKMDFLRKVAKLVGVDLDDVLKG